MNDDIATDPLSTAHVPVDQASIPRLSGDHVCRRLVLFLDGTWNEDEEDLPATNIVYLRERLFWGLETRRREARPADLAAFATLPASFRKKGISGIVFDGFEYIAYYDRGVGTGPFLDAIKGGLTGDGLDHNIREAYRFLSLWFRPGDEIFIFGFSRGAFTARSLCGYLQAVGLLQCEHCTTENEQRAWQYYRTAPGDRLSGDLYYFRKPLESSGTALVHDESIARIRALCVFDTVGALGVPAEGLRKLNRAKYEFHDTDVCSLVDIRLHAVAIDEPRWAFEPSLWTKPKFKVIKQETSPTEQVWFAGAHADIGGGYVKWNQHEKGLSFLPLTWLLQRLRHHMTTKPPLAGPSQIQPAVAPNYLAAVPFFTRDLLKRNGHVEDDIEALAVSAEQHKPWAVASLVRPDGCRLINQLPLPKSKTMEAKGRVPHADPIYEMIHISALKRLRQEVSTDKGKLMGLFGSKAKYQPRNLIGVIPYIAATYVQYHPTATPWRDIVKPIFSWKRLSVVDWDGRPLDPQVLADAELVFKLLPAPKDIDITEMPAEMRFMLRDPPSAAPSPTAPANPQVPPAGP